MPPWRRDSGPREQPLRRGHPRGRGFQSSSTCRSPRLASGRASRDDDAPQALLGGGNVSRAVMGGHKGHALALVLEILWCVDRAGFGLAHAHERIGSFATPPDLGHLFMALNVNRLMPVPLFQAGGVATLIQQLRASELATGVEHIYLGELECRRREVALQDGIPARRSHDHVTSNGRRPWAGTRALSQLPGDDHGYVAVYPHAAHHPHLLADRSPPTNHPQHHRRPGVSPQRA